MSNIIRPARFSAFARSASGGAFRAGSAPEAGKRRRRMIDGRFVGMMIAGIGLAWILALAGTAFAVRAMIVLCFAALAGRTRASRPIQN